jgi:hypothetical protein
MITSFIRYIAKKSDNVQVQVLCATLYGLVSIFGIGPTVLIIMKMRKKAIQAQRKPKQHA